MKKRTYRWRVFLAAVVVILAGAGIWIIQKKPETFVPATEVSLKGPYGTLTLQMPEEWTYEIQTEKQDTVYGIRFYRGEDKENEVLVKYDKDFPGETCGTGLEEKKIRLAGEKALKESRDGFASGMWEEIVFLGEKSDIHILNPCGETVWWKENEKQVMQILDTLRYDPETTADECQVEVQQQIEEGFLPEGSVTGITISTHPGEERYELSDAKRIKTVTNYLNHLKMEKNSSVDPEDYDGMTSDIQVNYAGGKECMVQHMANQFVQKDGGPWYQLEKEEGLRWDSILEEVSG